MGPHQGHSCVDGKACEGGGEGGPCLRPTHYFTLHRIGKRQPHAVPMTLVRRNRTDADGHAQLSKYADRQQD